MRLTASTHDERGTIALGRALGTVLGAGDVVALEGELGAGKTRFVRGVCEGLGLDPVQVSSPTFVLMNEYGAAGEGGAEGARAVLRHVDAYRLRSAEDLESMGWDCVADGAAVLVVEWASRIAPALEEAVREAAEATGTWEPALVRVRIESGDGPAGEEGRGERLLTMDVPGPVALRAGWERVKSAWGAASGGAVASGASLPEGWARCPTTGKPVPPESPTFPFFDERARMADLGRWMTGSYRVSREITPEDEEELPPTGDT